MWLTLSENCQTTAWWYHKCANEYQKSTQHVFLIRIIRNFSNCGNWQLVTPNDFLWSSNSSSVPKVSTVPRMATLQQWVEFWGTARQTCVPRSDNFPAPKLPIWKLALSNVVQIKKSNKALIMSLPSWQTLTKSFLAQISLTSQLNLAFLRRCFWCPRFFNRLPKRHMTNKMQKALFYYATFFNCQL